MTARHLPKQERISFLARSAAEAQHLNRFREESEEAAVRVRSAYEDFAGWAERFHFAFLPAVQRETGYSREKVAELVSTGESDLIVLQLAGPTGGFCAFMQHRTHKPCIRQN